MMKVYSVVDLKVEYKYMPQSATAGSTSVVQHTYGVDDVP
jgi:hypothetical protein